MDFDSVETFIASGNVVFDAPGDDDVNRQLEKTIEAGLREGLGYNVDTFVRSLRSVRRIVEYEPFARAEMDLPTNDLYVAFLKAPLPAERQVEALSMNSDVDALHFDGTELYWLRRRAVGESAIYGAAIERALGPITTRNMTTVRRLLAKYG